jgi:hypothetical protein
MAMSDNLPAVDLPADVAGLITALRSVQERKQKILDDAIAPLDEMIAALTERIQQALGDAEVGRLDGREIVRYTYVRKFDAAKFKANEPEIAAEFFKEPAINLDWLKRQRPDLHWKYSEPSSTRRFSLLDGE